MPKKIKFYLILFFVSLAKLLAKITTECICKFSRKILFLLSVGYAIKNKCSPVVFWLVRGAVIDKVISIFIHFTRSSLNYNGVINIMLACQNIPWVVERKKLVLKVYADIAIWVFLFFYFSFFFLFFFIKNIVYTYPETWFISNFKTYTNVF